MGKPDQSALRTSMTVAHPFEIKFHIHDVSRIIAAIMVLFLSILPAQPAEIVSFTLEQTMRVPALFSHDRIIRHTFYIPVGILSKFYHKVAGVRKYIYSCLTM